MILAIGTNDTLASPAAQLDFYQSVIDKMAVPRCIALPGFMSCRKPAMA